MMTFCETSLLLFTLTWCLDPSTGIAFDDVPLLKSMSSPVSSIPSTDVNAYENQMADSESEEQNVDTNRWYQAMSLIPYDVSPLLNLEDYDAMDNQGHGHCKNSAGEENFNGHPTHPSLYKKLPGKRSRRGSPHEDLTVCRAVCNACRRFLRLSVAALCWTDCESGGTFFDACVTSISVYKSHSIHM